MIEVNCVVIELVFEKIGMNKLIVFYDKDNFVFGKVMEKLGMCFFYEELYVCMD